MRGSRFAVQQSGLRQHKRAGAYRHGDIGRLAGFADPMQHGRAVVTLGGDHDHFRTRCVGESEIRHNLHAARSVDQVRRSCDGIGMERHPLVIEHNVLEHFPGPGEIDHHGAVGNQKCYGDCSGGRRRERIHHTFGRARALASINQSA